MNDPSMCIDGGYATGWEAITASRRFHHRLEVFMDQCLEHIGMTFAQYRVLELVSATPELHVSEMARQLRVTRQAALASVEKLERGDLVERIEESGRVYVKPSELAARRLELARRNTEDVKQQLEEALSPAELFRLVLILRKGTDALRSPTTPEWWLAR
jgi:DNA-binding MarR family transcriptional regulator